MPVSGVCASAAPDWGTEALFCCWWEETCQRFAPDRVILERTSAFDGVFFLLLLLFVRFFFFFLSAGAADADQDCVCLLINLTNFYSFTHKENCISWSNLSQGRLYLSPFFLPAWTFM